MDRPTPDLAGYREAQITLIENLGTTVPFFKPTNVVWPPNTPMDPETEVPYDPTVLPVSSGYASAAVKCGIVLRPLGLSRRGVEDDVVVAAIGAIEEGEGVLLVPKADYEEAGLEDATLAVVHDETYRLTSVDPDGIGEEDHRMIVYITQV